VLGDNHKLQIFEFISRTGRVAQVVENMPSKHEDLSSITTSNESIMVTSKSCNNSNRNVNIDDKISYRFYMVYIMHNTLHSLMYFSFI
jgi:hypothetical protein